MDAQIREAIRAAEAAAADVPFSYRVVAAPPPPPDLDYENWQRIRILLGGEKRAGMDRDYRVWKATQESLRLLREALMAESGAVGESPVFSRLMRVTVRSPRYWSICRNCGGKGSGDVGYCRTCQGHGWRT